MQPWILMTLIRGIQLSSHKNAAMDLHASPLATFFCPKYIHLQRYDAYFSSIQTETMISFTWLLVYALVKERGSLALPNQ